MASICVLSLILAQVGFVKLFVCVSQLPLYYKEYRLYFSPKIIIMTGCQWKGSRRNVQKVGSV